MDFPHKGTILRTADTTLQIVKGNGTLAKIPPDKLKVLLSRSTYKTVDEIPPYNNVDKNIFNEKLSHNHRECIKKWAKKFIKDNGGVKGVKALFRNIFLTMNPKYLPEHYLDIENTTK
jgi:hypothetical protein